ncbi:sulfite exporter TauE/SafE family protein [Methylotenera oryzisoli]|uniref:Probable membrane transporter protein n=1 Tax=Methylotenera oryzisoli TaxID=2080758 RepID=A0A4Y9VQA6_9PROT|nr:sulfite exporter TauE/SafE family protein [Methylotenera oryzisoli]TFW70310.1 sulfite exporter TauE/SafE family protein [Methylotenera oryzisoli]
MILYSIFIAALLAFSMSVICGGGAGLLLIPILGYALPASQVPAALSIGTSVSSTTKLSLFYSKIDWKIVKLFLPAALPGVVLGAWLLSYLDPTYIELCMAIFLVSNLPYVFKKEDSNSNNRQYSNHFLRFIGLLAGFISGLTGAVGVLFNGVYLRYGLDKTEIVATRAANEILLHIIKLFLYAYLGLFTLKVLKIGLIVAIAAVFATYLMKFILPRISIGVFSKFGYGAMVVSGFLLFNSAILGVQEIHNPSLHVMRMAKGYDATLSWDDLLYSVEFKYNEGFELERIIPLPSLALTNQALVHAHKGDAAKIVIEKVYSLKKVSHEAYYYDANNQLVNKVKF